MKHCRTCAYLKRESDECPCAKCRNHEGYEWKYLKVVILLATFVIGVLSMSGSLLFSPEAVGDVLGVPIEVPEPYDGGCDD